MTSFRDSIAFSSVILSGLSSDVCFFMSAVLEERDSLLRSRKAGGDINHVGKKKSWVEKNREEKKLQTHQQEIKEERGRYGRRKIRRKRQGGMYLAKKWVACVLPLRRRATLGSLCTGLMSSSTSVCLPHSGLEWLICRMKVRVWQHVRLRKPKRHTEFEKKKKKVKPSHFCKCH